MARRSTGQVVERHTKRGVVFAFRFYAAGARRSETLGGATEGWSPRRAEDELAAVAAVRAGTWQPRQIAQAPESVRSEQTFHEFASEWLDGRRGELRPRTITDDDWALSYHLLPFFAKHDLAAITALRLTATRRRSCGTGSSERHRSTRRSSCWR
jgi:hypothetical protein